MIGFGSYIFRAFAPKPAPYRWIRKDMTLFGRCWMLKRSPRFYLGNGQLRKVGYKSAVYCFLQR